MCHAELPESRRRSSDGCFASGAHLRNFTIRNWSIAEPGITYSPYFETNCRLLNVKMCNQVEGRAENEQLAALRRAERSASAAYAQALGTASAAQRRSQDFLTEANLLRAAVPQVEAELLALTVELTQQRQLLQVRSLQWLPEQLLMCALPQEQKEKISAAMQPSYPCPTLDELHTADAETLQQNEAEQIAAAKLDKSANAAHAKVQAKEAELVALHAQIDRSRGVARDKLFSAVKARRCVSRLSVHCY
jgi:hypothetical protein